MRIDRLKGSFASKLVAAAWLSAAMIGLSAHACTAYGQDAAASTTEKKATNNAMADRGMEGWHGRPADRNPADYASASDEQKGEWNDQLLQHWKVVDGVIHNDGEGPYLSTDTEYGDFELSLEYSIDKNTDSGIYLRGNPQVQIWDPANEEQRQYDNDKGSGGLWNNPAGDPGKNPLVKADKPVGQWNAMRIRMAGERTWVWLNEKVVVEGARMANFFDKEQPLPAKGPIQFQTHGGPIRWRNIAIRELTASEANTMLASLEGAQGWDNLFDGKSLDGWQGAVEDYTVIEGAIQCLPDHGGNLFTKTMYDNFQARLEIQLPAGGNNGLMVRYPGEGDGAYEGMCELQVLDNDAPQYEGLDPRQTHGSAYGIAPAARGYHRPTGEWNYQVVTVIGSQVQVELNGTRILDADLSTIGAYMADSPHPGKDRTNGYFGFAGHNDPVRFRNVAIRTIK
jgi:hypothetical protein